MTHPEARTGPGADARICLEFPTNLEVIRCAEKYRWHKHKVQPPSLSFNADVPRAWAAPPTGGLPDG